MVTRKNLSDCTVCKGKGETEQVYTAGCGMGSYKSMGPCSWCNGIGLVLKNHNGGVIKLKLDLK